MFLKRACKLGVMIMFPVNQDIIMQELQISILIDGTVCVKKLKFVLVFLLNIFAKVVKKQIMKRLFLI